jgi:hypothetical protein
VSDPRQTAAAVAGPRVPQWARTAGWVVAVICWAVASDARPWLAVLSLPAAALIRDVYVIVTGRSGGFTGFWSPWFFVVAAACELAWLFGLSALV